MTSEDRELRSIKERRASQSDADVDTQEEITAPHDLIQLEREKYESDERYRGEMDAIQDRYYRDPAFRALWNLMRRQRRESNRTLGRVADAATEVHQDVGHLKELGEKLQNISDWKREVDLILKIMKWILGVVFAAAVGSVIVLATKIYTWGVSSGELEIRLQHLEHQVESNRQRLASPSSPSLPYPTANNQQTRTP